MQKLYNGKAEYHSLNTYVFFLHQKIRTYIRTYITLCANYYLCKNLFGLNTSWENAGSYTREV